MVDYVGGPSGLPSTGLTYYDNDAEMEALQTGSNPPEIIWRSTKNAEEIDDEKNNFPPTLYGNGRTNPTQNLVDAFPDAKGYPITDARSKYDKSNPYANRDPRLAKYIIYNGATAGVDNKVIKTGSSSGDDGIGRRDASTRTGYYMKKMLRMTANCNPSNTSKVTKYSCKARFTEFFLDYAEAANEAWGPKNPGTHAYSAYDVIKAIRHRAGLTDDTYLDECAGDQAKMRELIRNERRLELCFEGFRFWDLRRWNQLDKLTSVQGIDWNNDTFTILPNVEERHFDSYMNYGYIPYSEALKYSNLHQNKGWK
ncbi:MAG: RagB/SusD family nutrient uptake outer membrane protein [Segatella copri]|nr:RagB/SusD family nutrient uptake outer membrane protein [Segatella copri]